MYIILDGYSICYKSWFSYPSKGFADIPDEEEELEAVASSFMITLCNQLVSVIREIDKSPNRFAKLLICWDGMESVKLRRKVYPPYKKAREKQRDPRTWITPHNFISLAREEFSQISPRFDLAHDMAEADDVIALICDYLKDEKKVLLTRDKDMYQLIDDNCIMFEFHSKSWVDEKAVIKDLGITPSQVVEYKALVGDMSDNYPGIRGIGPKRAKIIFESGEDYSMNEDFIKYKQIATIPFPEFRTEEFSERFKKATVKKEMEKILDWHDLCDRWEFSDKLRHSLGVIV